MRHGMPAATEHRYEENEKLTKYGQLAFEMRERRPGYVIKVVPVIIGALGGGMKMLKTELKTVFNDQELVDKIAGEMQEQC